MRPALLACLAALLLAAACIEQEPVETQDIVSTIPWPDEERAEYVLLDAEDEDEQVGTGVLTVTRQDDQFELHLEFEGERGSDESMVVVDATTLKPRSVSVEVRREDESERVEGEYDPDESVLVVTEDEERTIPLELEENYYDNESSLYLWRSIPFREGYEASYHSVLARLRTNVRITVQVIEKEEVTVPAGTFDAWRVEVSFQGREQVAWYADTPERPLVKYDNTRQIFELTDLR